MIRKLFLLAGLLASASSQTAAETTATKAPKASNAVSKASNASNKVDESTPHLPAQASGCQHIPNTNQS
jgi:hypothetical protein